VGVSHAERLETHHSGRRIQFGVRGVASPAQAPRSGRVGGFVQISGSDLDGGAEPEKPPGTIPLFWLQTVDPMLMPASRIATPLDNVGELPC
jgi:hypothetical protein